MRTIQVQTIGGPDVMRLVDVAIPEPGPGQVRVKLVATGVNFIDIYFREGLYQQTLPFIPGSEGSGIVDAIGPDVAEVQVGDRVASMAMLGAYAEFALVPATKLVPVPVQIDMQVAAAVMLQGITAHYLTHSTFPLRPNQTALVHAAAGGVGQLLVQIAKHLGARVIATVSTEEKAAIARQVGADEVIRYTQQDFAIETKRLTGGQGVDVVYDSVGKDTFDRSLDCLHPRGMLVLYGQSSGAVPPINPQILNAKGSLFLTRPTAAHYVATRAELMERATDLFTLMANDELLVRIDQTFPLDQAATAHRYLADRQTKGKVLLQP